MQRVSPLMYYRKSDTYLPLKRQAKFVADDIFFFFFFFPEKTSLDISCESSAKQMIHMKCQDLFSLKNKKKKKKMSSAAVVIDALRVKFCCLQMYYRKSDTHIGLQKAEDKDYLHKTFFLNKLKPIK